MRLAKPKPPSVEVAREAFDLLALMSKALKYPSLCKSIACIDYRYELRRLCSE